MATTVLTQYGNFPQEGVRLLGKCRFGQNYFNDDGNDDHDNENHICG